MRTSKWRRVSDMGCARCTRSRLGGRDGRWDRCTDSRSPDKPCERPAIGTQGLRQLSPYCVRSRWRSASRAARRRSGTRQVASLSPVPTLTLMPPRRFTAANPSSSVTSSPAKTGLRSEQTEGSGGNGRRPSPLSACAGLTSSTILPCITWWPSYRPAAPETSSRSSLLALRCTAKVQRERRTLVLDEEPRVLLRKRKKARAQPRRARELRARRAPWSRPASATPVRAGRPREASADRAGDRAPQSAGRSRSRPRRRTRRHTRRESHAASLEPPPRPESRRDRPGCRRSPGRAPTRRRCRAGPAARRARSSTVLDWPGCSRRCGAAGQWPCNLSRSVIVQRRGCADKRPGRTAGCGTQFGADEGHRSNPQTGRV